MQASLPRRIGAYELLEEIGRGGMGIVYRARQDGLHRTVALKLMLGGTSARRSQTVARFQREAEAVASLRHPHIVAIHELGEHLGQPFFSMDLVAGQSLADLVSNGPLPTHRALIYLKTIAEAVAYAHTQGILHRDLKPTNILIDSTDQPRILDFGLAKKFEDESDLTCTGSLVGSPSYMPPEQLAGRRGAIGPAGDVYALGAILYHLLTGRPPFVATDIETILLEVLEREPLAPRLLNPSVPIDLESVCLKCLEKEPARRYASAQSLADDLGRFARGEPTMARPVRIVSKLYRWCKRKPALAGLATVSFLSFTLVAVVTAIANVRLAQKEAVVRQNSYVADMHFIAQAIEANNFGYAEELLDKWRPSRKAERFASPMGKQSGNSGPDLRGWEWRYFWGQCQGGELVTLASHESSVLSFAFSWDGKRMASGSFDGEVKLWEIGSQREIASAHHGTRVNALAFSPDGQRLASGSGDALVRFWDTGDMHDLGEALRHSNSVVALAFSSDGRQLLTASLDSFTVWDVATHRTLSQHPLPVWKRAAISPDRQIVAMGQANGTVVLWSVSANSTVATLSGHTDFALPVAFSPDGLLVASGSFDSTAAVWDVASRRHLANLSGHTATVSALAFSPDSKMLATVGYDQTIFLWETVSWRQFGSFRGHHSAIWSVAFSPDGTRIVSGGKDGTIKIWNVDSKPATKTSIQTPTGTVRGVLSCDGKRMIAQDANHRWSIWELDSSQTPRLLPILGERVEFAGLTADPYALLVTEPQGGAAIWDQTGSQKILTLPGRYSFTHPPTLSTDGRLVAWQLFNSQIIVRDVDTDRDVYSAELTTNAWARSKFSPDGRTLVICSDDGPLLLCDLVKRSTPSLLRGHKLNVGSMSFSRDGTLLATAGEDGTVKLWDLRTHRELSTLKSGADALWSVTISPDGKRVAAGTGQGTVVLWDRFTQQHLATLKGHRSAVVGDVVFTPDGNTLVSKADDGVRFWRAASFVETDTTSAQRTP